MIGWLLLTFIAGWLVGAYPWLKILVAQVYEARLRKQFVSTKPPGLPESIPESTTPGLDRKA